MPRSSSTSPFVTAKFRTRMRSGFSRAPARRVCCTFVDAQPNAAATRSTARDFQGEVESDSRQQLGHAAANALAEAMVPFRMP